MGDTRGRAERVVSRAREKWTFRGRQRRLTSMPLDGPPPDAPKADVVVSLTSHRRRLPFVGMAVRSLMDQSISAARVELWLSETDADHLPADVRELQRAGLEIMTMARDLGSAAKLLPAQRSHPGRTIVTADDDVIYPYHWLRDLLRVHEMHPAAIVCARAHYLRFDSGGSLRPYEEWDWDTRRTGPDARLFFTGHSGVLYPGNALPEMAHDDEVREALCPRADDVWFNWMARIAGTSIVRVPGAPPRHNHVLGSQSTTLMAGNLGGGGNDAQIANLVHRFGPLEPASGEWQLRRGD